VHCYPLIIETKAKILLIAPKILQAPETTAPNHILIKTAFPLTQPLIIVAGIGVALKVISYLLVTVRSYGHDL
jgi:hypothetical protein